MEQIQEHSIVLGNSDWYVLRRIEDKYLIIAEAPLFAGYYSLEMCPYAESKLAAFIENKFIPYLERNGVDISQISNVCVPSVGQFNLYLKGRVPNTSVPFMTQSPDPDNSDCIIAIDADGNTVPFGIRQKCGIRPCMFINAEYADTICNVVPVPIVDFDTETNHEPAPIIVPIVTDVPDEESVVGPEPIIEVPASVPENEAEIVAVPVSVEETETITIDSEPEQTVEESKSESEPEKQPESESVPESEVVVPPETDFNSETIMEETVASAETEKDDEETEESTIQVGNEEFVVDRYEGSHAAYVFAKDEEYKQYAVLYQQNDENVQKMLSDYSRVVLAFVNSSRNDERTEIDKVKVATSIAKKTSRWRWKEK